MSEPMQQLVKKARRACGMSRKEAAEIVGFNCTQPYASREDDPDKFTVGQFFSLYHSMDDFAKQLMWGYIESKR